MPVESILAKLNKPIKTGNSQWRAPCPAHGSTGRTLSIKAASDGHILLHCFAGCSVQEIVDSVGLRMGDLFPSDSTYERPLMSAEEAMRARVYVELAKNKRNKTAAERAQAIEYAQRLKEMEAQAQ